MNDHEESEERFRFIFNEVNFMRELSSCENIVQLEAVYLSKDQQAT